MQLTTVVGSADGALPSSLARLSFALTGRDCFPEARIREFQELPDGEREAAIENTRAVRAIFERQLRPGSKMWRRLELALFSCDHDWRRIAEALNDLKASMERSALTKVALGCYVAYLRSREHSLLELLSRR